MNGRPAFFLDRDGVINEEVSYLGKPEQLRLIEGAAKAVRRLNLLNLPVVVVTNQAGVARGYFTEEDVVKVHAHLDHLLAQAGARIDLYRYCPHFEESTIEQYRMKCLCRKPQPGMLLEAAEQLGLDPRQSVLVGDRRSDLEAGRAAGCQTILVRTGYGSNHVDEITQSDLAQLGTAAHLAEAVEIGLRWMKLG
jgi:D-glycero-D-manno-heptose 1,7-bisphosphate phosphatase